MTATGSSAIAATGGEEAQRRHVGPLRVVDDHQHGTAFGDVLHDPEDPVDEREDHLRVGRAPRGQRSLEQRLREPSGASEELHAPGRGRGRNGRLQQAKHDTERKLALERVTARAQHPHAGRLGCVRGLLQQPRLAGASLTVDECHASPPVRRPGQRCADGVQLRLPLEQWRDARLQGRGHGRAESGALPPVKSIYGLQALRRRERRDSNSRSGM
jgi:hypothetical protein